MYRYRGDVFLYSGLAVKEWGTKQGVGCIRSRQRFRAHLVLTLPKNKDLTLSMMLDDLRISEDPSGEFSIQLI